MPFLHGHETLKGDGSWSCPSRSRMDRPLCRRLPWSVGEWTKPDCAIIFHNAFSDTLSGFDCSFAYVSCARDPHVCRRPRYRVGSWPQADSLRANSHRPLPQPQRGPDTPLHCPVDVPTPTIYISFDSTHLIMHARTDGEGFLR